MSGETRAARSKALLDKKRRLEELKARRSHRNDGSNTSTSTSTGSNTATDNNNSSATAASALSASQAGNLDDYINGLLNSAPPGGAAVVADGHAGGAVSMSTMGVVNANAVKSTSAATTKGAVTTATATTTEMESSSAVRDVVPQSPVKTVETFVMATQTDEHDFPSLESEESEDQEVTESPELGMEEQDPTQEEEKTGEETKNKEPNAKPLTEDQLRQTISSQPFSKFFTSASKRVERLLGSSHLSDLLVDDITYYTDLSSKRQASSSSRTHTTNHVVNALEFKYPPWTANRDVTSIDWSPHHRGEVVLTSYNVIQSDNDNNTAEPNNNNNNNNTSSTTTSKEHNPATKSLTPQPPSSTLLSPSNKTEISSDGLVLLWNLSMPHRPEAVFTCASPVLFCKFHPTEANLMIGACHSGQVVVWDVRDGRLPVQKSNVKLLDSTTQPTGHVHSIVGMELVGETRTSSSSSSGAGGAGGSGAGGGGAAAQDLVTVDSVGKVNVWTCSNLVDPKESWNLPRPNGYATALAIAPVSHSLVVGDECGKLYGISSGGAASSSSSNSNATAGTRAVGSGTSGSNVKRMVHEWNAAQGDGIIGGGESHFGNVTGLATKVMLKGRGDGDDRVPLSRGYVRGVHGLVLSCGIDWTTKLWAPAYTDKPILTLLSHSYDYMCDVQW